MAGTKKVNFRLAYKSSSKDFSRARPERQFFLFSAAKASERAEAPEIRREGLRDNHVFTPSYWAPVRNQTLSVLVSGSWMGWVLKYEEETK